MVVLVLPDQGAQFWRALRLLLVQWAIPQQAHMGPDEPQPLSLEGPVYGLVTRGHLAVEILVTAACGEPSELSACSVVCVVPEQLAA